MYTEINYDTYSNWKKWLELFGQRSMYWYCWETKCYKEIRSEAILSELYLDEDYIDGIFILDENVF